MTPGRTALALLCDVCGNGHLNAAKWLVERFGMKEWELFEPFAEAFRGGHIEVAEWITRNVDDVIMFKSLIVKHFYSAELAGHSGKLAVVKWYFGMFPPSGDDALAVMSMVVGTRRL
ncbi:hypothetical protein Pelo_19352 [Pelomyxa schiedti]|nr:hypothetical protein Pelo_19352 [Pelomyxa schiedti]